MKYVVLGFLFWFTALVPGAAESAGITVHRVVAFKGDIKKSIGQTGNIKMCGKYFAAAQTNVGKVVLFTLKQKSELKVVLGPREVIAVLIDESAKYPRAIMGGDPVVIRIRNKDYRKALPCLADPNSVEI